MCIVLHVIVWCYSDNTKEKRRMVRYSIILYYRDNTAKTAGGPACTVM